MKQLQFEKEHKGITFHVITVILFAVLCIFIYLYHGFIISSIKNLINIFNPIIIGIIFFLILFPIQNKIEKEILTRTKKKKNISKKKNNKKIVRVVSMIIAALILCGVILAIILIIIPQAINSYNDLNQKAQRYTEIAKDFIDKYALNSNLEKFSFTPKAAETLKLMLTNIYKIFSDISPYIINIIKDSIQLTTDIFMGIVISIYIILDRERLVRIILRIAKVILPKKIINKISSENQFIIDVFNQYINGKTINIIITWVIGILTMMLFNIPYAPLISVILAIMNVIPYVGIFIGAIPCIFIVFITQPSKISIYIIILVFLHIIDTKFIEPHLLKSHTKIDAVTTIISIVLFSGLFGFWFMFIAVPVSTILYHFISDYIDKRLVLKSLPSDTESWKKPILENNTIESVK